MCVGTWLRVGSEPRPPRTCCLLWDLTQACGMHHAGQLNRMAALVRQPWWLNGQDGGQPHDEEETLGWFPATTGECGATVFQKRNSAVSSNQLGLFSFCRENLSMWEKIACGEVEDVVPSPPYDSGPVKVDNWLPKSLLARQRNTTCILPRTSCSVGGWTHIPRCRDTDQLKATWLKTQLPHWVTEVSTLMVSPTPETDGLSTGRT